MQLRERRLIGIALNAVIGGLRVSDVFRRQRWHVTVSAVGLIRMMFGSESFSMASEAFASVIGDLFFGRRVAVGIVTAATPHFVAGLTLANALRERLILADGARSLFAISVEDKIMDVVGEALAGLELIEVFGGLLDGDRAFEVTLHADRVTTIRRKFGRIDDGAFAVGMIGVSAVATLAGNAAV